ncbi:MAG: aminodeoxychorismate/anthranilate synthase component II [Bacteroidales bacterium]|nr:aminodeoxychorismate/anthranilate synthase component II [Bacteroidales bacterium]
MIHILLVDNNDSFTYNILEALRANTLAKVDVLRQNQIELTQVAEYDKIILSPGPGLPSDFPLLYQIIDEFKSNKSILGICLGHQAICSYFGANLVKLPIVCHGQSHEINVNTNSKLYRNLPEDFNVGLYHSWAVDTSEFPQELEITGISDTQIIMSVAHNRYDLHGIQFHPESFISEHGAEILKNFIRS